MSDHQPDGAIIVVANHLFGPKKYGVWKKYMTNSETTKNTLPAHSNRRHVEVQVEAMPSHMTVEELMTGEACVVYYFDGSAQSSMGNYVAQSLKLVYSNLCQIFIFSPNDSPSKATKSVFYFI